jgi:hypothetical protein
MDVSRSGPLERREAAVAAAVEAAPVAGAHLVRYDGIDRFDVLPLSLLSDGAVQALGVDRRRLRPNVIGGRRGTGGAHVARTIVA